MVGLVAGSVQLEARGGMIGGAMGEEQLRWRTVASMLSGAVDSSVQQVRRLVVNFSVGDGNGPVEAAR